MQECAIANVIVAAMNQAFFTLSLGIGAMAIFGSYIGKGRAPVSYTHLDVYKRQQRRRRRDYPHFSTAGVHGDSL